MNEQELPTVIRQPAPSVPKRWGLNWRIIIALNLVLGVFLWFLYCTNHSLPGIIPNIIYALAVGVIALLSLRLKDKGPSLRTKRCYKLSCLPSLIGGGLPVLLVLPPFCCLGVVILNDIKGFKQVQSLASPDHTQVAIVYEIHESTVTTHSYTMTIRMRHRLLPFVERTVYRSRAWLDQGSREYVRWKDNETLQLIPDPFSRKNSQREVKIAPVQFKFSKSLWGE